MAKKIKEEPEIIEENIQIEPLESVMSDRYASYAKYVIQDRAIPDVRDGLKPVQRRIIYTMYNSGNTFNKPTKKCAHTVGAVMGQLHPHGDTSIYDALARLSQDWKMRYPLVDFQGNNGSIDGDSPAAYRYTESRLSELSNELVKDIEKNTVDMQFNFDDTIKEPTVLPAYFPNLFANGTEGIAVAIATEIPPHNLRELIDAIIYRINHKRAICEELLEFVKGPDFPSGGIIYKSEGLKNIYLTGRGKIEVTAKTEIIEEKDSKKIVITEIPYKVLKSALVFEIDKIIHSKAVSGLIEIRDESSLDGIRIVIDCKKDAKIEVLLQYLRNKTPLLSSYSANMVAIVDGKPKTLNLLDYVDAYINHQVDVTSRKIRFDLDKANSRLHIVDGLIVATININEVVNIIRKSNDKADCKVNLMAKYNLSDAQAEAIVTMPLFKLSHTDETILLNEKKELEASIGQFSAILSDENKLNNYIIKNLKEIAKKYGDDRRTIIEEKGEIKPINNRDLIAKEETVLAVTSDGYVKRSTIKSYRSSADSLPGLKEGDYLLNYGIVYTTDFLLVFTNKGNFASLPIHKITENKWKEEGTHINSLVTLQNGEKIIKAIVVNSFRDDLYIGVLSELGQIKRTCLKEFEGFRSNRTSKFMNLLRDDEVVGVELLSGNSTVGVLTENGNISLFNENDLNIYGLKAGGIKSISGLGKDKLVRLFSILPDEKSKLLVITNRGHYRVVDLTKIPVLPRLGKNQNILPCFKSDIHKIVSAVKLEKSLDSFTINLYINDGSIFKLENIDLKPIDVSKYAKKNIVGLAPRAVVLKAYDPVFDIADKNTVSFPIVIKEKKAPALETTNNNDGEIISESAETAVEEVEEKAEGFEQMSIFDDIE